MDKNYCTRTWLNKPDKRSSGAVVCYVGDTCWEDSDKKLQTQYLLELSDCHGKVALHKTDVDTVEDFIDKLKLLSSEINKFIEHLEK